MIKDKNIYVGIDGMTPWDLDDKIPEITSNILAGSAWDEVTSGRTLNILLTKVGEHMIDMSNL